MTQFVDIINLNALIKAIQERNAIERDKLNFEKEKFEFNKKCTVDEEPLDWLREMEVQDE
jgi:hypothetical protein